MSQSHIFINQISFNLPTGEVLFNELTLAFSKQKTGLVGRNGVGKSTLIQLILGELSPHSGFIQIEGRLAYVPQHSFISSEMSVADLLGCEEKINALHRITQGSLNEDDFFILNEDWAIEDRIQQQLAVFGLHNIFYDRRLSTLSGGEITRLLLVKAFLSEADFLLLDEPTNHLDSAARQQLYNAILQWHGGLIVISHDRDLLNLMEDIVELTTLGASCYGGNYAAYAEQKSTEKLAKEQQLHNAKKLMRKTENKMQLCRENYEKKQSYGGKLRQSGRIDKIASNSKKGRSERTQNRLLIKKERLINQAETVLQSAKDNIELNNEIYIELPETFIPNGKIILNIEHLNFSYPNTNKILMQNFNLILQGPERIALIGDNGSGKTTLVKLILNFLQPQNGKIHIGTSRVSYLDQNASLLNPDISILENFLLLNCHTKENDAYRHLAQFLFKNIVAHKLIKNLSGGEKLRALLACVLMSSCPPQLLILDEPTNHLDLYSIGSIESALKSYQGAMIIISHDRQFLENMGVIRYIYAPFRDQL